MAIKTKKIEKNNSLINFDIIDTLLEQIKKNNVSSGYLFYGPGKKYRTARFFAKIFLCEAKEKPCQGECCQAFERGNHRDFIVVNKEKKDTKIKIERIREIRRSVALKTTNKRVILIRRAELLSLDAANALLKTLEEPASQTIFLLTTSNIKEVIPTIISRCQGFYLSESRYPRNHDREKKITEFLENGLVARFHLAKELGSKKETSFKFIEELERILHRELLKNSDLKVRKKLALELKQTNRARLLLNRNISGRLILEDLSLRINERKQEQRASQ